MTALLEMIKNRTDRFTIYDEMKLEHIGRLERLQSAICKRIDALDEKLSSEITEDERDSAESDLEDAHIELEDTVDLIQKLNRELENPEREDNEIEHD